MLLLQNNDLSSDVFIQYSSLWQDVRWRGYVPKSQFNRIFKYLGAFTKRFHIEGGNRLFEKNVTKNQSSQNIKRREKGHGSGSQRLLDINDTVLGKIRLNCANLESLSFKSCKLDYFSR